MTTQTPEAPTLGCRACRNDRSRRAYTPVADPHPGPRPHPPRPGDKRQARHRVNYQVDIGARPDPNALPCTDCGHIYTPGGKRHEYDHAAGYGEEAHEFVEAVCSACHHRRSAERGEARWATRPA